VLDVNRRAGGLFGCSGDRLMLKDYGSAQGKSTEAFEILGGQREGTRGAVEILLNC